MKDRLPEPVAQEAQPVVSERASASAAFEHTSGARGVCRPASRANPRGLAELQAWMLDAICGPHQHDPDTIVASGPRLSPQQRLDIYRYGYTARLTECLRDDYPVLAATLAEPGFAALCEEYIARHPSSSPSLNAFGRHMARVCETTTLIEAPQFHAELARLEWALVEVTHAQAARPLDLTELQRVPADAWGAARLIGSDTVRLLTFRYPINTHYQVFRGEGRLMPLPAPAASATAVYRRDTQLWRMDLTPAMTRVLSALLSGQTIAEGLAQIHVREHDPGALAEAERSVMIWFQAWIQAGIFARVVTEPQSW